MTTNSKRKKIIILLGEKNGYKKTVKEFMSKELVEEGYNNISDDESLIDLHILDSLSMLKLLNFMDEEFDIFPNQDELQPEKIDTINQIVDFISKKLEMKQ